MPTQYIGKLHPCKMQTVGAKKVEKKGSMSEQKHDCGSLKEEEDAKKVRRRGGRRTHRQSHLMGVKR